MPRRLAANNALSAADAKRVEQAFDAKLAIFPKETADPPSVARNAQQRRRGRLRRRQGNRVDKTVLALPTPRRIRDREHVKSVARQPCLLCGRRPADAHHLRFAQLPASAARWRLCCVSHPDSVALSRGSRRPPFACSSGPESLHRRRQLPRARGS
jgi:hypothetical protein